MQVSLSPQYNRNLAFSSKQSLEYDNGVEKVSIPTGQKIKYSNPINSGFEYLTAVKATLLAGFAFTAKLFLEGFADGAFDGAFSRKSNDNKALDALYRNLNVNAPKVKQMNPNLKIALLGLGLASLSTALYCVFTLPKNLNKTRIETFKKKKEMDVYVRANSAEKHLSERINNEAKNADDVKKAELMKALMTLKMSKNDVPTFVDKRKVMPQNI